MFHISASSLLDRLAESYVFPYSFIIVKVIVV